MTVSGVNKSISVDAVKQRRSHPPLCSVRLMPGTAFYEGQQNMLRYLLVQDTDSMLYNFRVAAGVPTGGAQPMTGWDAPECKLKGHTTGHYLSGLSLAYAVTGDERLRAKASALVDGLAECQTAFAAGGRVHPGFLSAYDEEQFDLLEKLTKYPEIWAPYYTLDKIMSGLLDAYELADITEALDILLPLGDWVYERLSRLSEELRAQMWDTYIAGEYGGMIGTIVRLHRISGSEKHLEAAMMFENARLFDPMLAGRDELDNMHANQHIPQIIGAVELYAATGDTKYLEIARNFHSIVTGHHCYSIGGTGDEERFRAPDSECSYLTEKTAESCASVNMLRLTSRLFEYEQSALSGLMDYYELTLFNHILMSWSHCADGGTTYFLPLAPGSCKHYETEENSCCHGTGMESRFRFMADIYSYEDDLVRVNLPVSSTLDDEEKLSVSFSEDCNLEISARADMKRELAVRIPAWARDGFPEAEQGYLSFGRLKKDEVVTLHLPSDTRVIPASDSRYYCIARGPYLLADVSGVEECLKPLFLIDKECYRVYFNK